MGRRLDTERNRPSIYGCEGLNWELKQLWLHETQGPLGPWERYCSTAYVELPKLKSASVKLEVVLSGQDTGYLWHSGGCLRSSEAKTSIVFLICFSLSVRSTRCQCFYCGKLCRVHGRDPSRREGW